MSDTELLRGLADELKCPEYNSFPDIELYMDQVLDFLLRSRTSLRDDERLSSAMPNAPVVLRNGENANDKSVGDVVLLITEQIPNTAPRIAPAAGPRRIAPMMTGMCTVVALIIGSCIIPIGVLANKMTMAAISATWDM